MPATEALLIGCVPIAGALLELDAAATVFVDCGFTVGIDVCEDNVGVAVVVGVVYVDEVEEVEDVILVWYDI